MENLSNCGPPNELSIYNGWKIFLIVVQDHWSSKCKAHPFKELSTSDEGEYFSGSLPKILKDYYYATVFKPHAKFAFGV